jgi:2-dehydropantoate 2-reductase
MSPSNPAAEGPLLVVGAGAVGGYIAAHLARAGEPVTVLESWAPNREAIAAKGLAVQEPAGDFHVTLPVLATPGEVAVLAPRLVILCTKLGDAPAMVTEIEHHWHAPYLVTLNALADLDLAHRLGAARVMGCIVTGLFGNLVEPGRLQRHRLRHDGGAATFRIGEVAGPATPRIRAMVELLGKVDRAEAVDDLPAARWTKLVFNCMTSPLSALRRAPLRDLFLEPRLRHEMIELALEVIAIADAEQVGHDVICGIPAATWSAAARREPGAMATLEEGLMRYGRTLAPGAISGMAQDLSRGRRTEAWLINGAVVEQARQRGMEAPANAALIAQLDAATGIRD